MVLSGRGVPPVTIVDLDKGLYNILRKVLGAVRPGLSAGGTLCTAGRRGVSLVLHTFLFRLWEHRPLHRPCGPIC